MRFLIGFVTILGGLVIGCRPEGELSSRPGLEADPPPFEVPDFAVWRPFFFTAAGDHSISEIIGTAFAIRFSEQDEPLLVTAFHLLGPQGGLTTQIEPGSLREMVSQVIVSDAFGVSDSTLQLDRPIELAPELAAAVDWIGLDMVLVPVGASGKRFNPMAVSDHVLEVGDSIWMSTAVFGGAPASQRAHRATVTSVDADSGAIGYRFENERLSLQAADGAPLLDAGGRVVGMHLRSAEGSDAVSEPIDGAGAAEDTASDGDGVVPAADRVTAIGVSIDRLRAAAGLLMSSD